MDSFEFNKYAGAALATVLLLVVVSMLGEAVVKVRQPAQRGYQIAGVEDEAKKPGEAAKPEAAADEPLPARLAKGSAEAGEKAAKKCAACHTFDKGGASRVGPNLWGVVGGKMAGAAGFGYSSGLQGKGGTWGFADLDTFIANPKEFVPGTKMAFAGVKSGKERADLLLYLRKQADSPAPLPAQ